MNSRQYELVCELVSHLHDGPANAETRPSSWSLCRDHYTGELSILHDEAIADRRSGFDYLVTIRTPSRRRQSGAATALKLAAELGRALMLAETYEVLAVVGDLSPGQTAHWYCTPQGGLTFAPQGCDHGYSVSRPVSNLRDALATRPAVTDALVESLKAFDHIKVFTAPFGGEN